ncbi:hypothetical protein TNCV_610581 [Trichonephila clavipes]|nr:hypothetical protein TNCV_610581 [Trichonephila clavipes]
MDSLGHSSFPPIALGRQDDEEASPGLLWLLVSPDLSPPPSQVDPEHDWTSLIFAVTSTFGRGTVSNG